MEPLTALALDVNAHAMALGNETFAAAGAAFVRNRALPVIYNCNHVSHVTARSPQEIEELLARADREFEGLAHRRFDTDSLTPPEFVARLALEDYEHTEALILLLEGEAAGAAPPHDIRPLTTEEDWAAYGAAVHAGLARVPQTHQTPTPDAHGEADLARRDKQPPVQFWLAYVDGRPVAYLYSWKGFGGLSHGAHPPLRG